MKLSALDIRKQEFARAFRGYDPEEVDAFRHMLSQQWHLLTEDVRRLEQRIEDQNDKLQHYQKVEDALEEALQTAKENAKQRIEHAERKATTEVADAKERALSIVRNAESKARRILQEAEDLRMHARRTYTEATVRRNEAIERLQAFLGSELEMLEGFIKSEDDRGRLDPFEVPEAASTQVITPSMAEAEDDALSMDDVTGPAYVEDASEDDLSAGLEALSGMALEDDEPVEAQAVDDAGSQEAPEVDPESLTDSVEDPPQGAEDEIKKIRRILEDLDG